MTDPAGTLLKLRKRIHDRLGPSLVDKDGNIRCLNDIDASRADTLIQGILGQAAQDGEITMYEYSSVLDFETHVLHVHMDVYF